MTEEKKYRGVRRFDRTMFLLFLVLTLVFGAQALYLFLWADPTNLPSYLGAEYVVPYGVTMTLAALLCGFAASGFRRLSRMP